MSEKDPALRVTKAVSDYCSLHRNLILNFINGKLKRAVEHLVSVIKPTTLKALIEGKLEKGMSELKRDFLEFVGYLKKMAIIHEEHCHGCGTQDWRLWHEEHLRKQRRWQPQFWTQLWRKLTWRCQQYASDRDRTNSGHGRSSESTGTGKQSAREPPPCLNTKKCAGEKHNLSDCPHTGRDEAIVLLF
jgi:hypothetical protein